MIRKYLTFRRDIFLTVVLGPCTTLPRRISGRGPRSGSPSGAKSLYALIALVVMILPGAMIVRGQANVQGQWQTLQTLMPINPVHVSLLHNGKILIVAGSGNNPPNSSYQAALWDPTNNSVTTQSMGWDMFCNGMVALPDGREMIFGGNLQYDPFHGWQRSAIYNPATQAFTDMQDMAHGRWYPTATELGDGSILVFSGLDENGMTNQQVEIYKVQSGWSSPYPAPWTPPLYPRMHLLPNGNIFYAGPTTQSQYFYTSSDAWSGTFATTLYGNSRTFGSSVLLPLTPSNGYTPQVMIFGGGNPSTNTTEIINLSSSSPAWASGPSMSHPRIEMNATLLPDGKIVTLGGSVNDEDGTTASLAADLFDTNGTVTSGPAGVAAYPRLYHSVSLLLPDGTVWVAGGNPTRGSYENHVEIYSPPYLFNSDGSFATRPTISSVSPGVVGYGTSFVVQTPDAANIASVVLMKLGSVTHAFDMDQRMVGLSFTTATGALTVTAPPNGNVAPPGYYMLFVLNKSGAPSIAQFVQVSATPTDPHPVGTITSPVGNVVMEPGQSVVFAGSGTATGAPIASYFWSLRGGTPNSSTIASPGSVTYSTPGSYAASLTVVDSAGNWDPSPPTRTIQVRQPAPIISNAVPNSGTQGETNFNVTIAGGNFQSGATCAFGTSITVSSCTVNSSTQITANISVQYNAVVGANNITVTNPDGGSGTLPNGFGISAGVAGPAPSLSSVSPNSAESDSSGLDFTLSGSNFTTKPTCAFGEGIIVNSCLYYSPTQLRANIAVPFNTSTGPSNVTVTNADGQSSTLVNGFSVVSNLDGFTPVLLRGGATASYTDNQGIIWNADNGYASGQVSSTTQNIAGAIDPAVYQSERYGNFTYTFAVPNGPYDVSLKFAEIYWTSPGQRIFNVAINGTQVLQNFDIVAAAGAPLTAIDMRFGTTVTNGTISVQFTSGSADVPKISAIEITSASGVAVQVSPNVASLYASQTQQFTAMVTSANGNAVTWTLRPQVGSIASSGLYTSPASVSGSQNKVTVTATSVADPNQSGSAVVNLLTAGGAVPSTFVNSGGNAYIDTVGNNWAADSSFTGGQAAATTHAIANTPDPILYQTERYGDFSYQFPVSNGSYNVILKFSENYWTSPGQRIFNVAINGTPVLTNFDILANAGAVYTAIDKTFPATVTGNTITIQFTSGGADLPKIDAIEIVPSGPDFTLSAAPVSQSVAPGGSTTYTVTIGSVGGFAGAVTLSASGQPTSATTVFSPSTVTGSGTSTMTLNTTSAVAGGTYPLTITGTSGSIAHAASVSLAISQPAATPTFSPAAGSYSSPQNVSLSDTTSGASIYYTTDGATPTTSSTLYNAAIPVNSSEKIQAIAVANGFTPSAIGSASYTIQSQPAPDFTISSTPTSQSVTAGGSITYTLAVGSLNGFGASVGLSVNGLPTSATAGFNPSTIAGSGTSTLTITTTPATPAGTYSLTITGASGNLTHTTSVALIVAPAPQPNFSLSAAPSSLTISRGKNGTSTITVSPVNGFNSAVSLSISGLPKKITASFNPNSTSTTAVLTLHASSTAPLGSFTLTVTGISGNLSHTAKITLGIVQ